jgi:phage FluMu protein Com
MATSHSDYRPRVDAVAVNCRACGKFLLAAAFVGRAEVRCRDGRCRKLNMVVSDGQVARATLTKEAPPTFHKAAS